MKRGMTAMQEAYLRQGTPELRSDFHAERPDKAPVVPEVELGETRQQKWRRLHPEKYREGQKKLMARKRAGRVVK